MISAWGAVSRPDNPYAFQYHYYNNTQPENLGFLEDLRRLADRYSDVALLGEISSEDSLQTMADYTHGQRLHMGYSFELLSVDFSAAYIRGTVEALEAKIGDGWPCWAISNHDVERVLTRWGNGSASPELAKLLVALVSSLRGTACIYQGEELGLTEADVPFAQLRDPYGIAFWPNFKGRDGCRTPMPWDGGAHAAFSSAQPWLPVPDEHRPLSVAQQDPDPSSTLNGCREFLHWRRNQPALRSGSIHFLDAAEPVLAFTRTHAGQTLFVALNLGTERVDTPIPGHMRLQQIAAPGPRAGHVDATSLQLPAHAAIFATVTEPA